MPQEVVFQIVATLRQDQQQSVSKASAECSRLEKTGSDPSTDGRRLKDKLDGKIQEDFWEPKISDWRMEEQQVKLAIEALNSAETSDRALDAQRILELANKAYLLYISQDSTEKAKLLRMLLSNCSVNAVSVTPAYRKPFDMIFERVKLQEWSGRLDSN